MLIKILAIESATDSCSVALRVGKNTKQSISMQPRSHSELILPMVDELMSEAGLEIKQLDAIAFGCGPGSFTGLRIATGMVQGLAFGSNVPVVAVSSLAVLAQTAYRLYGIKNLISSFDARMNEIYWAVYCQNEQGLMELQGQEKVCLPEDVVLENDNVKFGAGSGGIYLEAFQKKYPRIEGWVLECVPEAIDLLDLAEAEYQKGNRLSPEEALPVYLREATNWKKLPGRN